VGWPKATRSAGRWAALGRGEVGPDWAKNQRWAKVQTNFFLNFN
jgi:hypothetical protein